MCKNIALQLNLIDSFPVIFSKVYFCVKLFCAIYASELYRKMAELQNMLKKNSNSKTDFLNKSTHYLTSIFFIQWSKYFYLGSINGTLQK